MRLRMAASLEPDRIQGVRGCCPRHEWAAYVNPMPLLPDIPTAIHLRMRKIARSIFAPLSLVLISKALVKSAPPQVRADEGGVVEVSGAQVGAFAAWRRAAADEAGVGEIGGGEVGVREVGLAEVGVLEVGVAQLASTALPR